MLKKIIFLLIIILVAALAYFALTDNKERANKGNSAPIPVLRGQGG